MPTIVGGGSGLRRKKAATGRTTSANAATMPAHGETSQPPGSNRRLRWNLDAASGKHFSGLRVPLKALQVRPQFARTLVAQVAIFLQALVDDALQFAGHVGIQSHRSDRSTFQNGVEDEAEVSPRKGSNPSPFRRAPHRTRTNPCVRRVPSLAPVPATYRRPCQAHCPDWSSVLRDRQSASLQRQRWCRLRRNLGQAEIENLGLSALRDKDVRRLDVAVNDPFECAASSASAISMPDRAAFRFPPACRRSGACRVMPSRNSMAMKARPSARRFRRWCRCWDGSARKRPGPRVGNGPEPEGLWLHLGQKFQGDKAAEPHILGLVDDTHPATAQLLNDAVVRDGLADHAQACYGGSVGKSMKARELAESQKGCWRKIAITLIDPHRPKSLNECNRLLQQLSRSWLVPIGVPMRIRFPYLLHLLHS